MLSWSFTDPPGWMIAVTPAAAAAWTLSGNGKNASDASTLPRDLSPAFFTAISTDTTAAPPHPHETRDRPMTKPEMKALLASLKEELKAPPRGVDKRVLQQFVDHLEKAAKATPASEA